jgi:hypothetical protein
MNDEVCLTLLRQPEIDDRTILVLASNGVLAAADEKTTVLGHPLSETEKNILRQARVSFQKDITVAPICWQVSCYGNTWVCAVNDVRLSQGDVASVRPGDCVDVGLLRFRVIPAKEAFPLRQKDGASGDETSEVFDLNRLADVQPWETLDGKIDPFEIIGIPSSHSETELSPDSQDFYARQAFSEPEDTEAPEEDIFARLAEEYAKVIVNPECLHQQILEEAMFEPEIPDASHHDMSQPDQEWRMDQSLEDFVLGKLTIQDILNRLGIDNFQPLEVSQSTDEVLALFAQDMPHSQKQTPRIPERTRRDHYLISLDSHYQPEESGSSFGDAYTAPDADSAHHDMAHATGSHDAETSRNQLRENTYPQAGATRSKSGIDL